MIKGPRILRMSVDPEPCPDEALPTRTTLGVTRGVIEHRRLLVRFFCVFFNVLSGLVNGYDICITTGILDSIDGDLQLCHKEAEVSTCFLKDRSAVHGLEKGRNVYARGLWCRSWASEP